MKKLSKFLFILVLIAASFVIGFAQPGAGDKSRFPCGNRVYEFGADKQIYDITESGQRRHIGSATSVNCVEDVLKAVNPSITLYYNPYLKEWKPTVREAKITVTCGGRDYEFGADKQIYDITDPGQRNHIGVAAKIDCIEDVLKAVNPNITLYYNPYMKEWKPTVREAKITITCAGRDYELTSDHKVFDVTSQERKYIGYSMRSLECQDNVLAAILLPTVNNGATLYYNADEDKWEDNKNNTSIFTRGLSPGSITQLDDFYEQFGGREKFGVHYVDAVNAMINAEDKVTAGDYSGAKKILDAIWAKYPKGSDEWKTNGSIRYAAFTGNPVAYNGLRMLSEIVDYQLGSPLPVNESKPWNLCVVLLGCSQGKLPASNAELKADRGTQVTNNLNPAVKANNYKKVRQSLEIFSRYITAITDGKLNPKISFYEVNEGCFEMQITTDGDRSTTNTFGSGFTPESYERMWKAIPQKINEETDAWWIIYPGHIPGINPNLPATGPDEFRLINFIGGGMHSFADGKGSPVFVADDNLILRKQRNLDGKFSTDLEIRTWLPHWFQHEFSHHLYNIYPDLNLEPFSHAWQHKDKYTWPQGIVGQYEGDYFTDAIKNKIKQKKPLLYTKILTKKCSQTDLNIISQFTMADVIGNYTYSGGALNPWLEGSIFSENGKYFWKTKAAGDKGWELVPDFSNGILRPKGDVNVHKNRDLKLLLMRNANGVFMPKLLGFQLDDLTFEKR